MKDLIERIEKLKVEIPKLADEQKRVFWEKLRLEWNYNSNHIEGNTLTYGETKLLLIKGETTGNHNIREYEEMKSHDVAIDKIREWAVDEERDITESDIRELNEIILGENFWKEAIRADGQATRTEIKVGQYKDTPNHVRLPNGEIFRYASVEETPAKMEELMRWYREENELPPVIKAAELHYRFVCIHPFGDGNGRIARLLMNYVLLRHGYPPIVVMSADKKNYLSALSRADAGMHGDFHEYIAKQLLWSLELKQKAANDESLEEPDDLDKEISIWKREIQSTNTPEALPRNDERVFQVLSETVFPLIDKLIEKSEPFDDLFDRTNTYGATNNRGGESTSYSEAVKEITKYYEESAFIYIPTSDLPTIKNDAWNISNYFEFQKVYRGFKKAGTKAFDYHLSLKVEFENYRYILFYDNNTVLTQLYSQQLTEAEQDKWVNVWLKELLEKLKKPENENL